MALKAGSFITTGHDRVLVERLQNSGPGTLNIPTEKIYELGNYESVATLRDTPDLTFTMESLDVSTDTEALICDIDPGTDTGINLATARPLNIATQIKPGQKQDNAFSIAKSVGIPYLTIESASYRFGLRDNASQTFSFRGDSIFYNQGPTYVDEFVGTGVAGQEIATTHPAYTYTDGNGTRRILAVVVGVERLSFGPDYQLEDGVLVGDAAPVTITLTNPVPVTERIRVMYASPDAREYPQAVHTPATLKPAAVRGKDIDVYIGGYDPEDIEGSAVHKWTGVQSVTVDWRVTLETEEEFGNYFAVSKDFEVPTVSGTVDILPRNTDDLFRKLREITGITSATASIGASTAVPLALDVVLKDGANGGITLKRLHCKDATFSVPGYSPRPNANVTVTLNWESDSGELLIFRDLTKPLVAELSDSEGAAGDSVKILGTNFVGVTAVKFGAVPATSYTVDSGRQITAVVPAGADTVDVTVTNGKGVSTATPAGKFTYA